MCFSLATAHTMGKEQFLGFYLSAGVVSSLASHIFKSVSRTAGISLGAVSTRRHDLLFCLILKDLSDFQSGAIMGVLGYFCSQYPDAVLQVAFIPGFTFSADSVSSNSSLVAKILIYLYQLLDPLYPNLFYRA